MAATVFPANPTVGTTHTVGFRVWAWNGIVWEVQPDRDPQPSHFIQSGAPDPADGNDGDVWFDMSGVSGVHVKDAGTWHAIK